MSQDAHHAPKMPAMIARIINQIAAPTLLAHFEALAANKPIISIESPHQNDTNAYAGYQIRVKIPSIASPPTIIKIMLPIKANAKPTFDGESAVVSVKNNSPPNERKILSVTSYLLYLK
jgi:hypothetical protein